VIRVWIADASGARAATPEEGHSAVVEEAGNVWFDFEGEDEAAVRQTLGPCGVHPLVVEDMVLQVNRPKLDDYGDYIYIVVQSARWDEGHARPSLREVDLVVGRNWVVTYHDGETRSVMAAAETLPRRPALLAKSPAVLMHFVLDVLVDHYLPLVERLAEEVDQVAEQVFQDSSREMHAKILRIKRGIGALRRFVGPQRDTLLALTRDGLAPIPAELWPYLRDVYDRLARVADMLDSIRDESASVLELYLTAVSNRTNEVIRRLTVIATIGLPLTVVTSYYGMNFRFPEYEWTWGEWYALGLMALTALGTWWYLRSRKWD
jgi:magnesium transporter